MAQDQVKVDLLVDISKAVQEINSFQKILDGLRAQDKVTNWLFKVAVDDSAASKNLNDLKAKAVTLEGTYKAMRPELRAMSAELVKQIGLKQRQITQVEKLAKTVDTSSARYQTLSGAIATANRSLGGLLALQRNLANSIRVANQEQRLFNRSLNAIKGGNPFDFLAQGLDSLLAKLTIGGLLVEGFKALTAGAAEFARQGAQFEQLTIGLEAFTSSVDEAAKTYQTFKDIAIRTPFGLPDVAQAGKILLAFGLDTLETSKNLELLSVAAGATGSDLNNLARNLGQIKAQQRAFKRDLDQFAVAGLSIYKELATVTGQSVTAVKELASEGSIGFDEVTAALERMAGAGSAFAEIASKQTETLAGQWGNLQTAVSELAGALVKEFGGTAVAALKATSSALDLLGKNLGAITNVIIAITATSLVSWVATVIAAFKQWGIAIALVKATGIINWVGTFIPAVANLAAEMKVAGVSAENLEKGIKPLPAYMNSVRGAALAAGKAIAVFALKAALVTAGVTLLIAGAKALWDNLQPSEAAKNASDVLNKTKGAVEGLNKAVSNAQGGAGTNGILSILSSFDSATSKIKAFSAGVDAVGRNINSASKQTQGWLNIWDRIAFNSAKAKLAADAAGVARAYREGTESLRAYVSQVQALSNANKDNLIVTREITSNAKANEQQARQALASQKETLKVIKSEIAQLEKNRNFFGFRNEKDQTRLGLLTKMRKILNEETVEQEAILEVLKIQIQENTKLLDKEDAKGQALRKNIEERQKEVDKLKQISDAVKNVLNTEKDRIQKAKSDYDRMMEDRLKQLRREKDEVIKRFDEELKGIRRVQEETDRKYAKEIGKLRERTAAEQKLYDLEKEKLRQEANDPDASEEDRLRARASYERLLAEEKITALEKEQEGIKDRLDAKERKLTEAKEAYGDAQDTVLQGLQDEKETQDDIYDAQTRSIDDLQDKIGNRLKSSQEILDIDKKIADAISSGDTGLQTQLESVRNLATQSQNISSSFQSINLDNLTNQVNSILSNLTNSATAFDAIKAGGTDTAASFQGISVGSKEFAANLGNAKVPMLEVGKEAATLSTSMTTAAGVMPGFATNAERIQAAFEKAAVAAATLKQARATGGPVIRGQMYEVNELGQEAFLGVSGALSLIKADRNSKWIAPERGTIIPAHLTKLLDIPEAGLNIPPQEAKARVDKIYGSTAESVSEAIRSISSTQNQNATELGKLSESIRHMTAKEWSVQVKVDNNSSTNLIAKARGQH